MPVLDQLMDAIYSMTKKAPADYTDLETTIGNRTFVYRSGAMATLIRYQGISKIVAKEEMGDIVETLTRTLNPFMLRKCHEVQFVFDRDIMSPDALKKRMRPTYETANRLGVGDYMKDIFDEQARTMAQYTMDETITIVLFTNPNALREEDYKEWVRQLREMRQNGRFHVPEGTQDETYGTDPQLSLHDAFVDQVVDSINSSDIGGQAEVCDIWEGSNIMAQSLDPLGVSDDWKAWLLPKAEAHLGLRIGGEPLLKDVTPAIKKAMPRATKIANTTVMFPPPLREQLLPHEATYPKGGFIEYAGRLYATLNMVIAPRREVSSMQLIYNLASMRSRAGEVSERVPFRLSMRIRANGLKQLSLRQAMAPLVAAGSYNNRKLMRAISALSKEVEAEIAMGSFSLSVTTWVDASDPLAHSKLKSRLVALRSAASQWGDMTTAEDSIDRFEALINSCPGLTQRPCSNEGVGNIHELLPLLPWGRPASPLGNQGTEFYRSLDGSLLPTASHSGVQDYWLETMTAPMGGGKSAQANRKHFDYIFAPGRTTWPFLHIVDIGGSVSGLIEMLQDALPPDQKHLVHMHTLRNNRRNAVNMLDTKLGLRYPLEGDLQATVEFLVALVTPAERSKPYDNMGEFIKTLLKAMYKRTADDTESGQPKLYRKGTVPSVDEALEAANIDNVYEDHTSWFEVCDRLGSLGDIRNATLAHRQAMPTLPELDQLSKDDNIRGDYMRARTETNQPIPEVFSVQLALARESYPIFTTTTVLDLFGRRITALDLNEVATKGSASARKQSSLMYMVGYELFTKNIRLHEDDLNQVPKQWLTYYQSLLEELKNTDKHVTVDEYHRTMIQELSTKDAADHDSTGIRATLVREGGRESRKWGLSLLTISQLTADHGQLFSLASGNHILKRGSSDETEFQRKNLNLSATDEQAMKLFVNGPTKAGVTFLSQWTTKKGKFSQLFTSTVGPMIMWSFSSTFEDKNIRRMVFDDLGRDIGRVVLAKHYPGGSAKDEVDRRKRSIKNVDEQDLVMGACAEVAQELIKQYRANPSNYK